MMISRADDHDCEVDVLRLWIAARNEDNAVFPCPAGLGMGKLMKPMNPCVTGESMKRKLIKKTVIALACSAVMAAVMFLGVLYHPDQMLADGLYQSAKALDGNIIVIGIDDRAMEDIGPYQTWGRDIMAMALEALNADEDCRPAVIGVDVLYTGESDPDLDAYLAEAAGAYGNVVVASVANFGTELITEDTGAFYMSDYAVLSYEEPYEALRSVTSQGHINAMYDQDGVLRHSILQIDLPDGRTVSSFAYTIYQKYAEAHGLPVTLDIPTDSLHRFYVDYAAMPGGYYDGISVADLLSGEFPAEQLKDAIVLIGPYAAGLSDYVTTPIDRASLMYGVEHQANVIQQMLRQNFKKEIADGLQGILVFIIAAGCLWFFIGRKVIPSTLLWIGVAGGSMLLCKWAYAAGYVLHPLWLPVPVTVFYVAAVAFNYVQTAMEKRKISSTFKRYVAPEIVGELLREGTDALGLGGKLCDIAVLFVDIRGFTTMSEVLTPQEVVSILNRYLTLTTECIMKNHGTLDKFVGDCTMAIWNAPIPQEDYVMRACRAALDMVEGSKALSQELLEKFGRTVSFGIGVHCGNAVVGNIGAEMRMDFTAIGDTVNTSARLEANAPPGKIYISRDVVDRLGDRIRVTSLGDGIALKGKSQKLEIFLLDGVSDEENAQEVSR